jgi:hypothetical protein
MGTICDPSTGQCAAAMCPLQAAPGPVATPATSPYCQASNLNCCFGTEGVSPYDADLDGFMACTSACGSTIQDCGGDQCDTNDNDPTVHP